MAKNFLVFSLGFLGVIFLAPLAWAFPFEGEIDFRTHKAELTVFAEGKPCRVHFEQKDLRLFHLTADIVDFRTTFFHITTFLEGTLEIVPGTATQRRALHGQLTSRYTLLDHKPVSELSGQFEIKNDMLEVASLNVGAFRCQGQVRLRSPYPLSLELRVSGLDLRSFLPLGQFGDVALEEGNLDGRISFSGTWEHLLVNGRVVAFPPEGGTADYQRADINFSGIYPVVYLSDSNIVDANGMAFKIFGKLDLNQRQTFSQQLAALQNAPWVRERADRVEWTLKKNETQGRSGTTELKYFLRKNKPSEGVSPDDNTGMLGVEHRVQF